MSHERNPEFSRPRGGKVHDYAQFVLNNEEILADRQAYLRPLQFDRTDWPNPRELEKELVDTHYNYNQGTMEYDGRFSASLVGDMNAASRALLAILEGDDANMPHVPVGLSLQLDATDSHPPAMNEFVDTMCGFSMATMKQPSTRSDDLYFSLLKRTFLHARLRDLYAEAAARGVAVPSIHHRLLAYYPEEPSLYTVEERMAILDDDPQVSKKDMVDRLRNSSILQEDTRLSNTYNSRGLMGAIFAASYAIEQKYPAITSDQATALLLQNADVIGAQSWHKMAYAPFFYDSPYIDESGRHHFSELIQRTAVDSPMVLNDNNRLEAYQSTWGMCPLANNYVVSPQTVDDIGALNSKLEEWYGVQLPTAPEGTITLSTQFAIVGTMMGQHSLNGRSREHIAAYYHGQ